MQSRALLIRRSVVRIYPGASSETLESARDSASSAQDSASTDSRNPTGLPTGLRDKRCNHCREIKLLDDFNRDRTKRDGRQALCRECQRGNYHRGENRAKAIARGKQYRDQNPAARRAHHAVEAALKYGRITKGFCECGADGQDAHHHKGYDKPLDVIWLCRSCHVNLEPRRGAA